MGSNFSGPGQSRHAAFGIAHQPCSWPQLAALKAFANLAEQGRRKPSLQRFGAASLALATEDA